MIARAIVAGAVCALLALSTGVYASWDHPNADPFRGDPAEAVMSYGEIPYADRIKLRDKMMAYAYDDVAAITKHKVEGRHRYERMRAMHFGAGRIMADPSRDAWADDAVERGLVYCSGAHCVIVPTICRNLALIDRIEPMPVAIAPPVTAPGSFAAPPPALPPVVTAVPIPVYDQDVLGYDPLPPGPFYDVGPKDRHVHISYPSIGVPTAPVPEVSTYALMLAGLGLVAWVARRRRK